MGGPENKRRLCALRPDQLDAEQLALYRTITEGPRARDGRANLLDSEGRLQGPFDAMLRSPAVGTALQQLGVALRYGGGLAARARELVILVVAAAEDSPFERFAHEAIGRALGLSDQDLESVRTGAELLREDPVEAAALGVARSLIADADLDDATYRSALTVLGERGLFEVTTLVGYYRTLALQLRTFRVGAPDHL